HPTGYQYLLYDTAERYRHRGAVAAGGRRWGKRHRPYHVRTLLRPTHRAYPRAHQLADESYNHHINVDRRTAAGRRMGGYTGYPVFPSAQRMVDRSDRCPRAARPPVQPHIERP